MAIVALSPSRLQNTAAFLRWWQEDWSWTGLAKIALSEGPNFEASDADLRLQDYWLAHQSELIHFGGRKWTPLHLPPIDVNGHPIDPAIWAQAKGAGFTTSILSKLEKASVGWADLRGIVFAEDFAFPDSDKDLRADFSSSIFLGDQILWGPLVVSFQETLFGGVTHFNEAHFQENANFSGAVFQSVAHFENSKFANGLIASGAIFESDARFDDAIVLGEGYFREAKFGRVTFANAHFGGYLNFDNAEFSGHVDFSHLRAGGKLELGRAIFHEEVQFAHCDIVGSLECEHATFKADVTLIWASVHDDVRIMNSKFERDFSLYKTEFGSALVLSESELMGGADLSSMRVSGRAYIDDAIFRGEIDLSEFCFPL